MSALILGIPSKGRLQEQVVGYLADAGLKPKQESGARGYRARIDGMPDIEVKLLSAADIATSLDEGDIHLGITGEDLLRDTIAAFDAKITLLQPLGLGFADVVVAVPRAWIDVSTMADLDDVCTAFHVRHHKRLRVATKYMTLTRSFFAAHGISDYRIVESLGATEGAPAAGTAEAIVDITTTGATLAANELKVLDDGVILKSQAQLAASLTANWTKDAVAAAEKLTARIAARELARVSHILRVRIGKSADTVVTQLEKAGSSLLSRPAEGNRGGEYGILCPRNRLMDAMDVLRDRGIADAVTVHESEYVFANGNPLAEKLRKALKR
jgi:ATP phosphoribosyltransferase